MRQFITNEITKRLGTDVEIKNRKTLLIVDDERMIRLVFTNYLADAGYETLTAANGEAGLELFDKHQPDIVLLDLKLPGMSGLNVLQKIREKGDGTPVIVISGGGKLTDVIEALRQGASDFFTKPVENMTLIEVAIERALERTQLIRENRAYHERLERLVQERTAALRASERRMNAIVETIPDLIYRLDPEGKITFINGAVRRYGYEPGELVGNSIFDYIHPDDHETARFHVDERRTGDRRTHSIEIRLLTRDQKTKSFDIESKPLIQSPILSIDAEGLYESDQPQTTSFVGTQGIARDITDQRMTQAKLRFQVQLLDSVRESVVATDLEGRITYWGRGAEMLYGYTAREVMGKPISLVVDMDDQPDLQNRFQHVLETGYIEGEFRQKRKDGTVFWSDTILSLVMNDMGKPFGIIGIDRDITAKREAEAYLRQLRKAVETMQLGVTITDTDEKIIYTNPAEARMHGYTVQELIGQDVSIFAPSKFRRKKTVQEMMAMRSFTRESVNIRKDGSTFPVQLISDVVKDMAGQPVAIVTTCEDITERKTMEQSLRASEEWLRVTLSSITEGVITTDTKGRIVSMNRAAESLTGWRQPEAEGRPFATVFRLIAEDTGQPFENLVDQFIHRDTIEGLTQHAILVRQDEAQRVVVNSGAPIRDRNDQTIGAVITFRDVTETRHLETAKRKFINAISHELRTPLTPIFGYTEMLLSMDIPPEQNKFFLNKILSAVNREKQLVDELLAVARLENDLENFIYREIDAHNLFAEMRDDCAILSKVMIKDRYATEAFNFEFELADDLKFATVNVDKRRIQQVLENLITNAIKYSPKENLHIHIKISLQEQGDPDSKSHADVVAVTVIDHGYGIPRIEHQQIFKSFYQIRKGGEDISDGIGQGLTLSKRYIEAHGGSIDVDSEPGQGSAFTFTIPIIRLEHPMRAVHSILIVEDDRVTSDFIQQLLGLKQFEVRSATTVEEGIEALEEAVPDLILLDLQLPGRDGQELIQYVEQQGLKVPLILCSAQPEDTLADITAAHPVVTDYVVKPFAIHYLLKKIGELRVS